MSVLVAAFQESEKYRPDCLSGLFSMLSMILSGRATAYACHPEREA
ncbi:MAG: hypothetical protein PUF71_01250 [Firmicutes bacterium]|nr:hypothetical protein [Bacillota bacterium]